jgi:pyruvate formate lyase activating enzyme
MKRVEARYYEKLPNNRVRCLLCPANCAISPGRQGICRVRENIDGILTASAYGQLVTLAVDPIEKKPLYHYMPGKAILSTGANGCNFRCPFCQNWTISQTKVNTEYFNPEQLVEMSGRGGSVGIAFTYTEPLVWFEYILDCAKLLKQMGKAVILVTNGYINEQPARELFPYVDAANIDLKSASPEFYKKVCMGNLNDVLRTIKLALEYLVKVELTNLIIPGENDSDKDLNEIVDMVAEIDPNIPYHISRYFPNYEFTAPSTSIAVLDKAVSIARHKLAYVYPGNYITDADTHCPGCGTVLIKRNGYSIQLPFGRVTACPGCNRKVDVVW